MEVYFSPTRLRYSQQQWINVTDRSPLLSIWVTISHSRVGSVGNPEAIWPTLPYWSTWVQSGPTKSSTLDGNFDGNYLGMA